jgi:hypothetical protein
VAQPAAGSIRVYPVLFIDAIVVKVRDGQVVNRPVYVVIGVTVNGERDILGLWAGDGGEGAKFWLAVLTEIKNRGVEDVCLVVCDGLKGLPESITTTWSFAQVQTCIQPPDPQYRAGQEDPRTGDHAGKGPSPKRTSPAMPGRTSSCRKPTPKRTLPISTPVDQRPGISLTCDVSHRWYEKNSQ